MSISLLLLFLSFCGSYASVCSSEDAECVEDHHVSLLQSNLFVQTSEANHSSTAASYPVSIPLQKQYVPISKNGKTIAYKTAYFGEVFVGSDQSQKFTVVFDTGSGHLLLPSTNCRSETCQKHRRYDRKLSPSAVDIEYDGRVLNASAVERDQVAIAFGTGEVLGEFVKEDVCLTSAACVSLRVVLALEMTPDPFGLFAFDGVLGLGLKALTLNEGFSFFGQMSAQNPQMPPRFAVFLSRTDDTQSLISFGGHDERLAASPLKYVPVAKEELGFWQVQIKAVRIGDQILEECADGECRAILDTGTSLLGVPRMVARSMHAKMARPVPEEAQKDVSSIDCRQIPGQMVHFDLGDTTVSLGVEDYSRPTPVNMTMSKNASESSQEPAWKLLCRSLLLPVDQAPPVGPKVFIWGEPVLRRYYTTYDLENKKIGFAEAGEALASSTPAVDELAAPVGSLLPGAPLSPSSAKGSPQTDVVRI